MTDNVELKALPKCPFCETQVKMYVHPEITYCHNNDCPIHGIQMKVAAFQKSNTRPSEAVEAGVDERPDIIHMGHNMGKDFVPWSKEGEVIAALTQPSPPIADEKK